ncbi:MAG: hypothetical protein QXJ59_07135 [Thermofilaceae archaeon]
MNEVRIKLVKKRRGEPTYVFLYTPMNVWRWYTVGRHSSFAIEKSEVTWGDVIVADLDRHEDIYVTIAKLCRARIEYEGVIGVVTNDEEMYEVLRKKLHRCPSKPRGLPYRVSSTTA